METIQFVMQFNAKVNGKELTDAEKSLIVAKMLNVKPYVAIREKAKIMKNIICQTTTIDEDTGILRYDSFERDLYTILTLLQVYTDLTHIDEAGYDLLCSHNLLEYVLGAFSKEYTICLGVMNTYLQDLESNKVKLEDLKHG